MTGRPVAHTLLVLGESSSGPCYTWECREPAAEHAGRCPFALVDNDDLDEAVRGLLDAHDWGRGVYFVLATAHGKPEEIELELEGLAEMVTMVGDLTESFPLSARPTTAMRYPGHGPEVDLRELIEHSLSTAPGAWEFDGDDNAIIVDASAAAVEVLAWVEDTYDVPPDQRTIPGLVNITGRPPDIRPLSIVTIQPPPEAL